MSHRLMAILEFDLGCVREALQLPETAEIVDARIEFGVRGRLQLKIEGAGWPTREGELLRPTSGMVTTRRTKEGVELMPAISWDFPKTGTETGYQQESDEKTLDLLRGVGAIRADGGY